MFRRGACGVHRGANRTLMSATGQQRRFNDVRVMSDLPQLPTSYCLAANDVEGHQQTCRLVCFHIDLVLDDDGERERKRRALADL